ncbi:MAG: hypothetical protein RMH84_06290 [Sulfolobales archaeon]|nr:hypothetical protein [Sulfolobales archaeon]MCX8208785.1 hypothetical protein [Sulfolobales archaeon]MDW8011180.1 hypothetical protein [Sulfolobales archaeon]
MVARVRVERSTSRRGLHVRVATYLAIGRDCSRATTRVLEKIPVKPTYSKGEAFDALIEIPPDALLVAVDMRRNPRRKVRGDVYVYDSAGAVLARAVYRKLKVRLVECRLSQRTAYDVIKCVVDLLKIPVKKYGVSKCKI